MRVKTPADWLVADTISTERHYTAADVAELWHLSETMVRELFAEQAGVLKFERPATRIKRAYTTLRIPQSVLDRVHRRWMCRPA
jgi:hypothetical protein